MAEAIKDMERNEEEIEREQGRENHTGNEGQRGIQTEGTGPWSPTDNEVREEGVTQGTTQETTERNRRSQEATCSQRIRTTEGG